MHPLDPAADDHRVRIGVELQERRGLLHTVGDVAEEHDA